MLVVSRNEAPSDAAALNRLSDNRQLTTDNFTTAAAAAVEFGR